MLDLEAGLQRSKCGQAKLHLHEFEVLLLVHCCVLQISCMEGTALYPVGEGSRPSLPFDSRVKVMGLVLQGQGQDVIPSLCVPGPIWNSLCKRVQQCHTTLHTSIATLCRRIIVWRRQGTFLLDYYDTLMETCNAKRANLWLQLLRTVRH